MPLFIFSPLLLPPNSTLFPYTTLFRSLVDRDHGNLVGRGSRRGSNAPIVREPLQTLDQLQLGPAGHEQHERHPETEDRKSTRLNSSHANISYAVFCLKKKKKKQNTQ